MPYSKNSERKAAVSNASHIHKGSVGILKQSLNHGFRFVAIHAEKCERYRATNEYRLSFAVARASRLRSNYNLIDAQVVMATTGNRD